MSAYLRSHKIYSNPSQTSVTDLLNTDSVQLLAPSAVFEGQLVPTANYVSISVGAISDQPATIDIQQGYTDASGLFYLLFTDSFSIVPDVGGWNEYQVKASHYRVLLTNTGAATETYKRLTSKLLIS